MSFRTSSSKDPPRAGLSQLFAVVLLIAITLVIGALLYAYLAQPANTSNVASEAASVVNSAGGNPATQYYANAEVSATGVTCSAATKACTIELINTGAVDAQAGGCYFSGGGGTGTLTPDPAALPAGGSVEVTCALLSGTGVSAGSQTAGTILLSNGATIPWVGNWQ